MSNYLPVDIETEIMKRLPVKTLLQFRTVSKAWKSIIDRSQFINNYQGQVQHLLLTYTDKGHFQKHVSYVDNDTTFPQQKCFPFVPVQVKKLRRFEILGCSNGLLCLSGEGCYPDEGDDNTSYINGDKVVVLWNISIGKAVSVVVPDHVRGNRDVIGFGVCGVTNEVKIVNIKLIDSELKKKEDVSCAPWLVEVFSLSTGEWKSVDNNFPRKSVELCVYRDIVVLDETMYWLATERVVIGSEDRSYNMIVSFDITKEEFKEVKLPDNLAQQLTYENLYIFKLRKSLAVIEVNGVAGNRSLNVWKMEDGISESFTMLYTICVPDVVIYSVQEFRKNGEPILEVSERPGCSFDTTLVVYEPLTKCIENIEEDEKYEEVYVTSYMETLHLLDQPDSFVYYKGNRFGLKQDAIEEFESIQGFTQ